MLAGGKEGAMGGMERRTMAMKKTMARMWKGNRRGKTRKKASRQRPALTRPTIRSKMKVVTGIRGPKWKDLEINACATPRKR
jgi:hypothetical protein